MFKKSIAFTMAEVMVVIGLLGVVGALTVPNLKKSYESKANAARARAAFMKLDSALRQVDLNAVLNGKTTNEARSLAVYNAMKDYLKLTISCGTQTDSNYCFTKSAITDSTGLASITYSPVSKKNECSTGILNDGTEFAICVLYNYPSVLNGAVSSFRGYLFIDVDGANKGPNTRGKDIFAFRIGEEGLDVFTNLEWREPEQTVFNEGNIN